MGSKVVLSRIIGLSLSVSSEPINRKHHELKSILIFSISLLLRCSYIIWSYCTEFGAFQHALKTHPHRNSEQF